MKLRYISEKKFPPFLDSIHRLKPSDLPIDATARIFCQHCGLWNRAILCPPLLYKTYPQYRTLESSRRYFSEFKRIYLYVFKNDGSKAWWFHGDKRFFHLTPKKGKGRQLKGCETSSARELTVIMRKIRRANEKLGHLVECFIQGHCDLCGRKCPNRENPPCERGGLASLESTGINVYKLLDQLGVEYEYPVINYLTQVTMMAVV